MAILSNNCTDLELFSEQDNCIFVKPYSQRLETYIVPVIFALIFLVGVLGNGTLLLMFTRHRNLRNVPNTYIISLALGDLLVIITAVPFTSTVYTFYTWPYGELVCKISEMAKDISIGVSVFTLTALSVDRYFAIVNPVKKLYYWTTGRGKIVAATLWLLAIVCAMPAFVTSYIRHFPNGTVPFDVCFPFPENLPTYGRSMVFARFIVYYTAPLMVVSIFYIGMARHLLRTAPLGHPHVRHLAARKKAAKTVLTFVVIFAICFLPHHVFMLWFYYYPNAHQFYNDFWHIFRIVGFCLCYLNSCVNPIALYCISGTFRKYFDRYLLCWRRNRWIFEENGRGKYWNDLSTNLALNTRRPYTQEPSLITINGNTDRLNVCT